MKTKKANGCPIAILVLFLFIVTIFAGFVYQIKFAKTEVLTSTEILTSVSGDNCYSLTIYMIGEPEWPFGATHCRFDLTCDKKYLIEHPFSIRDDGSIARESNFDVIWNEDSVTVIVSGSEQKDKEYRLNFDGTVGS